MDTNPAVESSQLHTEVSLLENHRSPQETYEAFYRIYGGEVYQTLDGRTSSAILAIQTINVSDQAHHLIIRELDNAWYCGQTRRHFFGPNQHLIPYRSEDFLVAFTDGDRIEECVVHNVHARYDGAVVPYSPTAETLLVRVTQQNGNRHELECDHVPISQMTPESGSIEWSKAKHIGHTAVS